MGQEKSGFTHQERGADPGEGPHGGQVGRFLQHLQLFLPDGQNLVFECQLPGVKLQHFDPVENFVHQLNPIVLALHVGHLGRGSGQHLTGGGAGRSLLAPAPDQQPHLLRTGLPEDGKAGLQSLGTLTRDPDSPPKDSFFQGKKLL